MAFTAVSAPTYTGTVENNGFWPTLDLEHFMSAYRVDTRLDEAIIRNLLVDAMLVINDELSEWAKHQWDHHGLTAITEKPAETLDGKHLYVCLYERAVYNRAKADWLREFMDYSTTGTKGQRGTGEDRIEEKSSHADVYYASSLKAVRRIKGRHGTRVALIKGVAPHPLGDFV